MNIDVTPLAGALRQIAWAADALEGIRRGTTEENAAVFPVVSEAYIQHIREQVAEATAFLQTHPSLLCAPPTPSPVDDSSPSDAITAPADALPVEAAVAR